MQKIFAHNIRAVRGEHSYKMSMNHLGDLVSSRLVHTSQPNPQMVVRRGVKGAKTRGQRPQGFGDDFPMDALQWALLRIFGAANLFCPL